MSSVTRDSRKDEKERLLNWQLDKLIMIFGVDTRSIKKSNEKKMDVAEMKMLRLARGHTLLDKIENRKDKS